jgi:hypothetical protein
MYFPNIVTFKTFKRTIPTFFLRIENQKNLIFVNPVIEKNVLKHQA